MVRLMISELAVGPRCGIAILIALIGPLGSGTSFAAKPGQSSSRPSSAANHVCPSHPLSLKALYALKASKFAVASDDERNGLALKIVACFDHPDPAIRDGVVFEAFSRWLRAGALRPETIRTLTDRLIPALSAVDARGFTRPFAALILSELARADRIQAVLTDEVRAQLVKSTGRCLAELTDHRGFDPVEGWRHGVAHAADLVLQLGLNPKVSAESVRLLLDALAKQVAPADATSYVFGEPERLARAVFFIHQRGVLDKKYWESWFARIGDPAPLADWSVAHSSLAGLAKRHDTLAFLHAVAFAARVAPEGSGAALAALADRITTRVLGG